MCLFSSLILIFFRNLTKDSKNNARKNKRTLKPNRFESDPFDKVHKKIKMNNDDFYEDIVPDHQAQNSIHDQIGNFIFF